MSTTKQEQVKRNQVLIVEPQNELRFRGPFSGHPSTSYIKLENPTHNQKVYFKIKTTAPKQYCVRPNCGLIKPKEIYEIAVCLQPFDYDPMEKNKHKFMVQTIVAPNEDPDQEPQTIWKGVNPVRLTDTKLKCVFENPVNTSLAAKISSAPNKTDSTSTDSKSKIVEDPLNVSPKPAESDENLLLVTQEIKQLRLDENLLRQENLQLKEEIMKWKNAALAKEVSLASMSELTTNSSSLPLALSTNGIIFAVVMVIVGVLIGKLI